METKITFGKPNIQFKKPVKKLAPPDSKFPAIQKQTNPNLQTPPKPKSNFWKIISIILVILVILALGFLTAMIFFKQELTDFFSKIFLQLI